MNSKIFALVPVKRFENSKSRLKFVLPEEARIRLTELLLIDTISTIMKSNTVEATVIVSADDRARLISQRMGAKFVRQDLDSGVDEAVMAGDQYCNKNGANTSIVIPHDLPLLRPEHIDKICNSSEVCEKCVVICPSLRHDGSNILLRKPIGLIKTHYDNDSYIRHIEEALVVRAATFVVLSDSTMIDIDTKRDIELLSRFESGASIALEYVKRYTSSNNTI